MSPPYPSGQTLRSRGSSSSCSLTMTQLQGHCAHLALSLQRRLTVCEKRQHEDDRRFIWHLEEKGEEEGW